MASLSSSVSLFKRFRLAFLFIFVLFFTFGCTTEKKEAEEALAQIATVVETDRIYDNISINGVSIGGLTKEEAIKKVEDELQSRIKNQKIIVKNADKTWALELSSLDYKYMVTSAVSDAFAIAREGDTEQRYEQIKALETTPMEITLEPLYDEPMLDTFLMQIANETNFPATEPTAKRENGAVVATDGIDGAEVDIAATRDAMAVFADKAEGGEVALIVNSVAPLFTKEALVANTQSLIGTYSTPITGSASRDINLTVASGYINGVTLLPGEIFSTNDTIGPTTYDRGYRNAPVIVNGKLEDGIGGGVCQVSSTLYNAVLFSEIEVVQRQNHSLVVGYTPIGRDATLAGDIIDFKFKNTTAYPIFIESYLEGKRLVVNIYGNETRPENRKIDFQSVHVSSTAAPASKEIPDPTLPAGSRVTTTTALGGQVVDVYKIVTVDGKQTERLLVDRSTYRARAGEIRVGTGAAAPAPAQEIPVVDPGNAPTQTPVEVPAEVPAEVPVDVPAEVPTEYPAEVPAETQPVVPVEPAVPQTQESPDVNPVGVVG